jgi:hypothetical protein
MGPDHSSKAKLQRSLNACLRIVTGAHRNSSTDQLLAETQMLSVKDQLNLICSQFLASAFRESHPSLSIVKLPTGDRRGRKGGIVPTFQSRFKEFIEPYLVDDVIPEALYKKTLKALHTSIVEKSKRSLINCMLGGPPPEFTLQRGLCHISPEQFLANSGTTIIFALKCISSC